jgi:hypothetical protein
MQHIELSSFQQPYQNGRGSVASEKRGRRETENGPKWALRPVPVVRIIWPKGRHPAGFRPARSATKRMSRLARLAERAGFELLVRFVVRVADHDGTISCDGTLGAAVGRARPACCSASRANRRGKIGQVGKRHGSLSRRSGCAKESRQALPEFRRRCCELPGRMSRTMSLAPVRCAWCCGCPIPRRLRML